MTTHVSIKGSTEQPALSQEVGLHGEIREAPERPYAEVLSEDKLDEGCSENFTEVCHYFSCLLPST